MKPFTLYISNTVGDSTNCQYPIKVAVTNEVEFKEAIQFDHVCGEYKNHYRSNSNFIWSDVVPMDCDNDHSDDAKDWVYPLDVAMAFPNCAFMVSYSRNHLKVKNGKSARPRFHVYFPIHKVTDGANYASLKKEIQQQFSYFDDGALGAARFLYGTNAPNSEVYEGDKTIDDLIQNLSFEEFDKQLSGISEGSRNSTMSHIAGKLLKRFGDTEECYQLFLEKADLCNPPLEKEELNSIWRSAQKFGAMITSQSDYIPPYEYNQQWKYRPIDYTDVGQATILSSLFKDRIRHSPATEFLVYNGRFWEESKALAQRLSQELTEYQLKEADEELEKCMGELWKNGGMQLVMSLGVKKAKLEFNDNQKRSYEKFEIASEYQKYVLKRRESKKIWDALKELQPMVQISPTELDKDEWLLNTPSLTYDLRTGESREHHYEDFITKQTNTDASRKGMDIWLAALNTFFVDDQSLIDYVQRIVGLAVVGKVYIEALVIAYGEGSNGKSTFWNVIARVLGTYSGNISADMLTVGCRRNVKPELAEAKGKRLLIAAELEEGVRMNTSNVKQLCSTDEIFAEKKFKSPFSYVPSHTLVLYTNHLPRVGAIDKGTWRRLIVVPFNAKIKGKSDIKNYADYLFEHSSEAILQWIIDGANAVITSHFKIVQPKVVQDAIQKYKEDNDWLGQFFDECCELDPTFIQKSGELYDSYRAYCARTGAFTRSTADFYNALEAEGMSRKKTSKGSFIYGVRLLSEFE